MGSVQVQRRAAALTLSLLAALTGCSSHDGGDTPPGAVPNPPAVPPPPPPPPPPSPPVNRAPSASAGADLVAVAGQSVALDASASSDPDGDSLTYAWNIVAGAGGGLMQPDQSAASFLAAMPGTYIVELTVRDAGNLAASDIIVIDVHMPRSATALAMEWVDDALIEGGSASLAIYLPRPAGAGGVDVTLLSSDATVAEVPATVHVPEGEAVTAFAIEGRAPGSVSVTASAGGMDPVSLTTSVEARGLELAATAGAQGLVAGASTAITIRLRDPAPPSGARVMLALADAARGTLSQEHVDIPASGAEATVTLTGTQPGLITLTASLTTGGVGEPLHVMVVPAVAAADRGSADLIAAARSAGTITEEQETIYSIQAAFGAADLPPQFRGNDAGVLDTRAGRLAGLRAESLSSAGQEAIARFLAPPIYAGSWGEDITPTQRKLPTGKAAPTDPSRRIPLLRAADVSCFERLRGMPRSDTLPHWRFIRKGIFKIWYPAVLNSELAGFQWYTAEENRLAALRVSAAIDTDFAALSAVLGDVLRDGDITCNGGDDAIDVYVTRVGWSAKAQVMPYLPGGCARPGWMWIAPDAIPDNRTARNIVVHELVHFFQLRYSRPDCGEWRYDILDEATATWALDFRYRNDQFEHEFLTGQPSYFDPHGGEWRASPLETGAGSVRNCNGYCDYLFFEWLSRKYTPNAIRQVLDATQSVNAQQAFDVGLGGIGGGLEQLWPRFALFQWNDHQAHVQDELQSWEGVRAASLRHGALPPLSLAIEATLEGQPRRDLTELLFDKFRALRDGELPPMTTHYLHLRFTDANVSRVKFNHASASLRGRWPRLRVQALQKIDGQWQAAEDWSGEDEKRYCRDKRAERIEELMVVYSNSHAGTQPFQHSGPEVVELRPEGNEEDLLTISNAACMPWRGTTRVTTTSPLGGLIRYTADVEFELFVPEGEDPEEVANSPSQAFVPASGTATVEMNWPDESGCVQSAPLSSGPIDALDARLFIDFDQRVASGVGITTIQGVPMTLQCPVGDPIQVTAPLPSGWLSFGTNLSAPLGDDGRTLRGSVTETSPMTNTTITYEWDLTAARE
jgi:hypothetical protein